MFSEKNIEEAISLINNYYAQLPKPSWDEYFLSIAFNISIRSEDPDIKHGAVLVNEYNQIIGTGYNGPIKKSINSLIPFNIRNEKRKWMIHAEENCILNTTQNPSERGDKCTLYITGQPCNNCLQRIINFGIMKIVIADRMGSITEDADSAAMRETLVYMSGVSIKKIPMTNTWLQKFLMDLS